MSTPENCQQSRNLYVAHHSLDIVKSELKAFSYTSGLRKIAADQIMKNSTQMYTMSTLENCQQSGNLYVDDHLLDIVKSEMKTFQ